MEKIKEIRSAYEALYEDLQVAAEDDYLEYLTEQFDPEERTWDTEETAICQLHSIIGEVINSYDDDYVEGVLDRCGVFEIMAREDALS